MAQAPYSRGDLPRNPWVPAAGCRSELSEIFYRTGSSKAPTRVLISQGQGGPGSAMLHEKALFWTGAMAMELTAPNPNLSRTSQCCLSPRQTVSPY